MVKKKLKPPVENTTICNLISNLKLKKTYLQKIKMFRPISDAPIGLLHNYRRHNY
jgi:hypothetical protein